MDLARLREQLSRQLSFLERSASAFDAGHRDEAIRIATTVRVMIHETQKSACLLTLLRARNSIKLVSTVKPPPQGKGILAIFDGVTTMTMQGLKPSLGSEIKGITARGQRTPTGFVVFKGSHAGAAHRPTAPQYARFVVATRDAFVKDGTLKKDGDRLVFTRDVEFSSPTAAAAVVHGGTANGLTAWKDKAGRTLKEIEDE